MHIHSIPALIMFVTVTDAPVDTLQRDSSLPFHALMPPSSLKALKTSYASSE